MRTAPLRTLLVVDVQEDFCEGGSLAVEGGREVARRVAELLPSYDLVVASTDWHVDPGDHFSPAPDYAASWPPHCVVGTPGSRLQAPLTEDLFAGVVRKGEHAAAYSAFDGTVGGTPLAGLARRARGAGARPVRHRDRPLRTRHRAGRPGRRARGPPAARPVRGRRPGDDGRRPRRAGRRRGGRHAVTAA